MKRTENVELTSSDEGEMRWLSREGLSRADLANDFHELLRVMLDDGLSEFQYVVDGDEWKAVLK